MMIKSFTNRFPYVGPIFWMISIQYYIIQGLVAAGWKLPYSYTQNTISDLGNTVCGEYGGRYVCSQSHSLMNASFIVLGITMMFGALLIYQEFQRSRGTLVGFIFMGLAGFGTLLVGLFPENTINLLHILGAFLAFMIGNLALIILGFSLDLTKSFRFYTLLSGFVTVAATFLFVSHTYLGLGLGGMERIASYPQTAWIIVFGAYISRVRVRAQLSKR